MKLSARNVLKGRIVEIARASTMTRISLDIGGGNIVNAAVTTVAVDDLKLAVGKDWGTGAYVLATLRRPLDAARPPGQPRDSLSCP